MKILAIGYYDDFARFFLKIKKELKKYDSQVEFKYLSLYLSGFLYFIVRFHSVSFFSLKAWINKVLNKNKYRKIIKEKIFYKGIDLESIIKYHILLEKEEEINLKLQALSYIDIIESLLNSYKPNAIILSGDSRMSIEILNIKAKEKNIKVYYFEQGPFGTTILDHKGVNANASIREWKYEDNKDNSIEINSKNIEKFFKRDKSYKYKRNPFYRGSDYIYQYIFSKTGLLPIDIKMEAKNKDSNNKYEKLECDKYNKNKRVFLLILQVPYDVNMVYHSPYYKNHFEVVKNVYENLPDNSLLLVREHPLYKGKYEEELYNFMYDKKISLDTEDLYKSIEKADVVIVNNSTVGIEAISKLKPVVVLGNSYYDNDFICLKLKEKKELAKLLKKSLEHKPNKKYIMSFLNTFLNSYLIDGHFRDFDLKASRKIAQVILNKKENRDV